MRRGLVLFGACVVAFCAAVASVEARMVYYEIGGQRYSYSTNNHQQVRDARRRIEAARAGSSARPAAEAERISNPFGGALGSPIQAQAAEPQVRDPRAQGVVEPVRRSTHRRAERRRSWREAKAEKARQAREAIATRRQIIAEKRRAKLLEARRQQKLLEAKPERVAVQPKKPSDESKDIEQVTAKPGPAVSSKQASDAAPRSVQPPPDTTMATDLPSGINPITGGDGKLSEEPSQTGSLAKAGTTKPADDKDLTDFVDQLRAKPR